MESRGRAAVARRAHNPKVIGSIPVLATSIKPQIVVHQLFVAFFNPSKGTLKGTIFQILHHASRSLHTIARLSL